MEWIVPLQPTEDHAREDIQTAEWGEPRAAAGGCALKEVAAWRGQTGASSRQEQFKAATSEKKLYWDSS